MGGTEESVGDREQGRKGYSSGTAQLPQLHPDVDLSGRHVLSSGSSPHFITVCIKYSLGLFFCYHSIIEK